MTAAGSGQRHTALSNRCEHAKVRVSFPIITQP